MEKKKTTFGLKHDEQLPHTQNDAVSSPSPEMFSFPGTPTAGDDQDSSEFEFGSCVTATPGSPGTPRDPAQPAAASPADQFFLNGRLLPHAFPVAQSGPRAPFSGRENIIINNNNNNSNNNNNILSRGTSIGSSVSSKEYSSLLSSRSNSTNSRGGGGSTCSTCSSARTSSSEASERRAFQKRMKSRGSFREQQHQQRNVSGHHQSYHQFGGSSQRWQFITAAPVLGPSRSRRSAVGSTPSPRKKKRDEREGSNKHENNNNNEGFLQRMLRTFLETCIACHAMETKDKEFELDVNNGGVLIAN